MTPYSIAAINQLPHQEKISVYRRFIPAVLQQRYGLNEIFSDEEGRNLLNLQCEAGSTEVIMDLRHQHDAEDPLLYAHLSDTVNGQLHVLLYIVNDPDSPRFDVDHMPDGSKTEFGIFKRNLEAEQAAMEAGLAPGQVRSGLRILRFSIQAFEEFAQSLGQEMYFVEPLYYHNAIIFERYGFAYQQGLKRMRQIHTQFAEDGIYFQQLDGSTPFRTPGMERTIRGRSWAIHDGVLGTPFSNVTMYKYVGSKASVVTFPIGQW